MSQSSSSGTSATLLQRIQNPSLDQAAWTDFVARYGGKIFTWCLRWNLPKADAEDVTQNVLLKLFEKIRFFTYDPSRSFRAWLKTVTHNAWQDYVESQRAGRWKEFLDDAKAPEHLEQCLEEEFQRALLEEAMARVQSRTEAQTWEAFRLLALEQQPGAAVARQLGMKLAAVYMAKSRVQKMLREEVRRLEAE